MIFIPSSNEDMISTIFNSLKELTADYQLTVVGLPTWQYFETIDPALLILFMWYYSMPDLWIIKKLKSNNSEGITATLTIPNPEKQHSRVMMRCLLPAYCI